MVPFPNYTVSIPTPAAFPQEKWESRISIPNAHLYSLEAVCCWTRSFGSRQHCQVLLCPFCDSGATYKCRDFLAYLMCCTRRAGPRADWIWYPVRRHCASTPQSATEDRTTSRLFLLTVGNSHRDCRDCLTVRNSCQLWEIPVIAVIVWLRNYHRRQRGCLAIGNFCHHSPSDHLGQNLLAAYLPQAAQYMHYNCTITVGNFQCHYCGFPIVVDRPVCPALSAV